MSILLNIKRMRFCFLSKVIFKFILILYFYVKVGCLYLYHILYLINTQIIEPMERDSKYQILTEEYWLIIIAVDNLLDIKVMNYTTDKISKFKSQIVFDTNNPLLFCFQSNIEVLTMLKGGNNYHIDFVNRLFIIKWKMVADGFEKNLFLPFKLNNEKLTEVEELKCQNMMLKKKLYDLTTTCFKNRNELSSQNFTSKNEEKQIFIKVQSRDVSQSTLKNVQQNKDQIQIQISSQQFNKNKIDKDDQDQQYDLGKDQEAQKKSKRKLIKKSQKIKNAQHKQKVKQREKQRQRVQSIKHQQITQPKKRGRKKKSQLRTETKQNIIESPALSAPSSSKVRITFANGDYYYGQIMNNLYHGYGLYYSDTNGTFQGIWENGKANGFGISLDPLGNRHSGYYIDDKRTGKGIDQYVNGQKYQGNFQSDCKSGFGKYIYFNGDYYEGYWKNDMYNGKGVETYQDGSRYEGYWIADEKDGQGVFINSEGRRFRQYWIKGIKQIEQQIK